MNFKTIALLSGVALLAGCPDGATPTGTPTETGDTEPPTEIPAFAWDVTMTDGDGVDDATGGFDADTTATTTTNSVANYADITEYEFGLAQTAVGTGVGWFGEDCDGVVTGGEDICHLMDPDTTLTLTRVATIGEIVPGTSTLNNVDFPVTNTPGVTFVIFGYNDADDIVECWAQGDNAAYYPNCDAYTPAM